jgi:hypothetical protein
MSQSFSLTPRNSRNVSVSNTETLLASGNTQLIELNLHTGVEKVSFQVDVTTQALDAFIVQGRVHQDASYFTIANAAADFSAPSGRILAANGALCSLAAAASGRFDLDTSGLFSVKVSASAAVDGAVVTIYATGAAGGAATPNVTLVASDIEIGAVEIKDGATDTRTTVKAASTLPAATDTAQVVTLRDAVSGKGYSSQPSFNRTADTNAYGAGDIVGTATAAAGGVTTFTNMGAAAGDIIITDIDLMINLTGVTAGMTSFRLHLYNATPPSALGDNAAWDLPSGDQAAYLGYVDFGTPVDVGSSLFIQTTGVNKKLRMGASTSLFGYLVTNGAFTPASGTTFYPRLNAVGV